MHHHTENESSLFSCLVFFCLLFSCLVSPLPSSLLSLSLSSFSVFFLCLCLSLSVSVSVCCCVLFCVVWWCVVCGVAHWKTPCVHSTRLHVCVQNVPVCTGTTGTHVSTFVKSVSFLVRFGSNSSLLVTPPMLTLLGVFGVGKLRRVLLVPISRLVVSCPLESWQLCR